MLRSRRQSPFLSSSYGAKSYYITRRQLSLHTRNWHNDLFEYSVSMHTSNTLVRFRTTPQGLLEFSWFDLRSVEGMELRNEWMYGISILCKWLFNFFLHNVCSIPFWHVFTSNTLSLYTPLLHLNISLQPSDSCSIHSSSWSTSFPPI